VTTTFPAETAIGTGTVPVLFEEHAQKVLATLADTSAATLFAFAEGLTNEPASHFSLAINYLAGNREPGEQPDRLTEATMRSALRNSVTWKDDEFIDQLGNARRPSGSRRGRRS
jgi:hypothetical protein